MTVFIVIGSILLFLALVLSLSVSVEADYEKDLSLRARILCFTVYRLPANPKKKKKAEKKAVEAVTGDAETAEKTVASDTGNTAAEKTEQTKQPEQSEQNAESSDKPAHKFGKEKKQSLDFDGIMLMINSASPPVKYLLRHIRIYDFYLDFVIGGEDAAKTAINYGKHCALVYTTIEWLNRTIRLDAKDVHIEADFDKTENDYFFHLKAKMRLAVALLCVIRFFGRTLSNNIKAQKTPQTERN